MVIGVFAAAVAACGIIAHRAGVLPGSTQASADSARVASPVFRVTSLAWPQEALGLAAAGTQVLWEQRHRSAAIAGLWSYDVRTQLSERLLGHRATGTVAGSPSASGAIIVWRAWPTRRGVGSPSIRGYDRTNSRRWTIAERGSDPTIADDTLIWVERRGAGPANDAIRGVDKVTDEEYSIPADGRVRDLAARGSWVAWISRRGEDSAVWAGSYRRANSRQLAAGGSAVAINRDRVVWATDVGLRSTAIVSWDRRSSNAEVLCRLAGAASSLAISRRFAVWVTTREATGPQVWAYDFKRDRAFPVSASAGEQASPVIVADTVFWADRRSGDWELYARTLEP